MLNLLQGQLFLHNESHPKMVLNTNENIYFKHKKYLIPIQYKLINYP